MIPAIIDTHKHVAQDRAELVDQHFAYYWVGTVLSLATDAGDLAFEIREDTIPCGARLHTAGRGITPPEPSRSEVPYWVTTEEQARAAVQELVLDLIRKMG